MANGMTMNVLDMQKMMDGGAMGALGGMMAPQR